MSFDYGAVRSLTIIPQTPTPLLDSWRMDVVTSAVRTFPGAVSRFPVQSGREGITDAVQLDPDSLAVTGVITDTPISLGLNLSPLARSVAMADLLEKMRAERKALVCVTSWTGAIGNRWVKQYALSKNQTTGGTIGVTMTIDKLVIVRTGLVPAQLDAAIQLLGMSTVTVSEF